MGRDPEFEAVRSERDPLRRARLATDLLAEYQQRSVELARLRREAIDQGAAAGLTYSAVAQRIGLSKGRVTQIRQTAPPVERALFGVGPLTLGIPARESDRALPVLASEDVQAADDLTTFLESMQFMVNRQTIPATGDWSIPGGDSALICGPKSSAKVLELLALDPYLEFRQTGPQWYLVDKGTGTEYRSPMDSPVPQPADLAYVGRFVSDGRKTTLVAGIHAIGSLGAINYLTTRARHVYEISGVEDSFSFLVASHHENSRIVSSEEACPIRTF